MIVGLIRPKSGRVTIDGDDVTDLTLDKRARRGVAYLPQEASAFRDLSVTDNIRAVLEFQPLSKSAVRDRIEELLEDMGLTAVRKSKARLLSGGERRRLEVARALAINPRFLLLDEPFAGIDPKQVEDLQSTIVRLKKNGLGVLITDHNVHEMLDVVDMATIIFQGQALKTGQAHDLVNDPEVREHYLGENFRWHREVPATDAFAPASLD